MKKSIPIIILFLTIGFKGFALAEDTVCYHPDVLPVYMLGEKVMFHKLSDWADSMGLFKLNYEEQHVKIYVVIDKEGKVINILNAGCAIDTGVDKILRNSFLMLKEFKPATKNGEPVLSATLYEFSVYPYQFSHNRYDVRVKFDEQQKTEGKNFDIFTSMFEKWIKKEALFPKNYKRDNLDGLVKIEFCFNKKGKATKFKILKSDKAEFLENSLITLFSVKAISQGYVEMIGPDKTFAATFDYVSFAQTDGFLPSNH